MTHVVHVASGDTWAGAEAQVAMLAEAQAESGLTLHVVTFCDGELARRLARSGKTIRVSVIDERQGALAVAKDLRRLLRTERPAILHAHGYKEAILAFLASAGLRIARVRTLHGVPEAPAGSTGTVLAAYDLLDRLVAKALRVHWIAVSTEIHSTLTRRFGRRVHRVANCVSVQSSGRPTDELRAELNRELDRGAGPILLYAGRLEPVKGPDVLIDAMPAIRLRHPGAMLLVAGNGSSARAIAARVERLGLQRAVRLLGHRSDVHDLMRLADVFVMPSRGEGMPTVLLEAMVIGCPVVATDVGAVREITLDGSLATVVAPGRPEALAEACIRLLDDRAGRAASASAAATEIRDRYSPARTAEGTLAVYAAAASEAGLEPVHASLDVRTRRSDATPRTTEGPAA